jgi:HPt (histidine-containing phosphotransfer) domain-containing protein
MAGKPDSLAPSGGESRAEGTNAKPEDCPVIEGLDTQDGLSRVAGNRKLYQKLLRQFVEQQGPAVGQIMDALVKGDVALAERLAHTLKGVAGNIGAKAVQAAAGLLEKGIREWQDGPTLQGLQGQVSAVLDPLVTQLQAALHRASATPAPVAPAAAAPVDPARSREAVTQLTKLLAEFDAGAVEFREAHQDALRPLFTAEAWAQFGQHVEGYAFADAQALLDQAVKHLPGA